MLSMYMDLNVYTVLVLVPVHVVYLTTSLHNNKKKNLFFGSRPSHQRQHPSLVEETKK